MKAKAVRLHGANDLRLDEFELPEIKEDEILVKVVSDSVCMSTYKCAILGVNHKRVHEDVADHPAIMGHEMAHAIREHTRERISSQYATQTGIGIAASIFGLSQGQAQLANLAGDLGIARPHSRTQESEADQIGLVLMAKAGYDPNAAITLWQKMQRASQGEPPQFLSTHPSSSNRIATLQALMPRVMPYYKK